MLELTKRRPRRESRVSLVKCAPGSHSISASTNDCTCGTFGCIHTWKARYVFSRLRHSGFRMKRMHLELIEDGKNVVVTIEAPRV